MGFFGNKKQSPMPEASETIGLSLTPDEIDLLRECMKRTEDYYRGLLLLKQDWNAEKNEAAIAMIKIRLNMIDKKKHGMTDNLTTIKIYSNEKSPSQNRSSAKGFFVNSFFNG